RVMLAIVAQQSLAAEAVPHSSHASFDGRSRPAERGRWAPLAQSLKCEVVCATNLVGSATRPCGNHQMQGQAPHRRTTGNRLRQVGLRLGGLPAVELLGSWQTSL